MDLLESKLSKSKNRHPWEISRAQNILRLLEKIDIGNVVDIGAGDKFFLGQIRNRVKGQLAAVDLNYRQNKIVKDEVLCLKQTKDIPKFKGADNVYLLMDVLEHIEDDVGFLKPIVQGARPKNTFLITVPAFQPLFSQHDAFVKHYRRYNRQQLLAVLKKSDLDVQSCHYFYASLLAPRVLTKIFERDIQKKQFGTANWRFSPQHWLTGLLVLILNLDFLFCKILAKFRIYLPGLSLVAICQKTL
ncbi:class I SAM-dependent methyltransferase [Candidatus Saccharibacteria bacterium]|nr:class I SAM-dependent methyltransferase [Candidatus Saccharibacteria bacterium]